MAKQLVTDAFWERVKRLFPQKTQPNGGRLLLDDRAVLTGILFILRSGMQWEMLPKEMGCGCGMTCWQRLRDWHEAGVCENLHKAILCEMQAEHKIDCSLGILDSAKARAMVGGPKTGPNLIDRGKPGYKKHHVLADARGIPLAILLTGANVLMSKS